MAQKITEAKIKHKSSFKRIIFFIIVVTFIINPQFADPFNSIKLYALLVTTATLIRYLNFKDFIIKIKSLKQNQENFLITFFILSMFIAALVSKNKYQAFFGEVQRQTGFFAYLAFVVILVCTQQLFYKNDSRHLIIVITFISLILPLYGIIQYTNNDFFSWNNQYNPIILTLGNPNFASALMAVLCMLNIGFLFTGLINWKIKLINLLNVFILFLNIFLSNSRQGIVALLFGIGFFLWVEIRRYKTNLGVIYSITALVAGSFIILGMLQIGFLSNYLYKDSISARGFYWRAGLKMFLDKPLFGIGVDNYAGYFKYYREENFTQKYGHELISSNAHNVPIQLLATGGLFVGISYLILVLFVVIKGFKSINRLASDLRMFQITIVSAYIVFLAQTFVSIDNAGLTIWGWFLMGLILALSNDRLSENKSITSKKFATVNLNLIISRFSVLLIFILISLLGRSELKMFDARSNFIPGSQSNLQITANLARDVINDFWAQSAYKLESANYLIQMGLEDEGFKTFKKLAQDNQTNPAFLTPFASMSEYKGYYQEAVAIRLKIEKFDPHNPDNLLQLARLYKTLNYRNDSLKYKNLILDRFPGTPQASKVVVEIIF